MTSDCVSIIIPCYNNGHYVAEAIQSALSQTYKDIEVIVVNDGSTDHSDVEITKFSDQIIYLNQANSGACVARNNGLERASGDFIKFLDADDILEPDCLQAQMAHTHNSDAVIFGDCILLHEDGTLEYHPSHTERSGMQPGDRATLATFVDAPVLISTTLYRRNQLDKFGGFNPVVRRGQEHELHLRLYTGGVEFEYRPQICFQYRQHFSSSRISVSSRKVSHFRILENFLELIYIVREGNRSLDWDTNKQILGRSAWRIGRRHLRAGDKQSAGKYFDIAKELGGDDITHGTAFYRAIQRTFGPVTAEKISILRHKIRSPFRPTD